MVSVNCKHCGADFQVRPYRAHKAKYCSTKCRDASYIGQPAFYVPPITQVELTCGMCGKSFKRAASRAKYGRGRHCSPECQYAAIKARPNTKVTLVCIGCGASFLRCPSHGSTKIGAGKYCTRACRDIHRVGAAVPNWFGAPRQYRGTDWSKQKRAARKRDGGTCQRCKHPGNDVHHIRPYRLFCDSVAANDLSNLVTLCRPCHRTIEAELQRTELAA